MLDQALRVTVETGPVGNYDDPANLITDVGVKVINGGHRVIRSVNVVATAINRQDAADLLPFQIGAVIHIPLRSSERIARHPRGRK